MFARCSNRPCSPATSTTRMFTEATGAASRGRSLLRARYKRIVWLQTTNQLVRRIQPESYLCTQIFCYPSSLTPRRIICTIALRRDSCQPQAQGKSCNVQRYHWKKREHITQRRRPFYETISYRVVVNEAQATAIVECFPITLDSMTAIRLSVVWIPPPPMFMHSSGITTSWTSLQFVTGVYDNKAWWAVHPIEVRFVSSVCKQKDRFKLVCNTDYSRRSTHQWCHKERCCKTKSRLQIWFPSISQISVVRKPSLTLTSNQSHSTDPEQSSTGHAKWQPQRSWFSARPLRRKETVWPAPHAFACLLPPVFQS